MTWLSLQLLTPQWSIFSTSGMSGLHSQGPQLEGPESDVGTSKALVRNRTQFEAKTA